MSSTPTHRAYLVQKPRGKDGKSHWIEIGSVWPHQHCGGFDVVIPEGLSVTGRIVCIELREDPADA